MTTMPDPSLALPEADEAPESVTLRREPQFDSTGLTMGSGNR